MRHAFDYEGVEGAPFGVPDGMAPRVHRAPPASAPAEEADILRGALDAPLDAPSLEERAASARRVLVLVDDYTRGTPTSRILPHVERLLGSADVTVLTAQGTHRRMSAEELDAKLGPYARKWRVLQHDWLDRDSMLHLGETRGGMPIVVNKALHDADFVLGIGHVGVHAIMGFSGGAKIVHPGVSGGETEAWTHWNANWHATEALMGVEENPIRREIEEGALRAGLAAVLNVVMDGAGRIQHATYGHPVKAQRACARVARALQEADVGEPAALVIADSKPADRDYWQSAKGLYCASIAVEEGGAIVLVTPNPEGVADNHPELLDLAALELDEIRHRVAAGRVQDPIAAAIAAYTARIRERATVHIVSSGIRAEDARRLGFRPHATIRAAVEAASRDADDAARAAILHGAGALLPRVRGRNDHLGRDAASSAAGTRR